MIQILTTLMNNANKMITVNNTNDTYYIHITCEYIVCVYIYIYIYIYNTYTST